MKRTWTIIGVRDVPGSFKWYQALFGQPATLPAHDGWGQVLDSDGLLGIECDEVIHSILDVMYANEPYTVIQRAMHIHPTVSELIPTVLGELKPLE